MFLGLIGHAFMLIKWYLVSNLAFDKFYCRGKCQLGTLVLSLRKKNNIHSHNTITLNHKMFVTIHMYVKDN